MAQYDTFTSHAHPGSMPYPLVVARTMARPLALLTLPLMIGALVHVLQGYPALIYLWLLPGAMLLAMGWTWYETGRLVAELHIAGDLVAVRTVRDVAKGLPLPPFEPLFEVRTHASGFSFTLGMAMYEFDHRDWKHPEDVVNALVAAKHH